MKDEQYTPEVGSWLKRREVAPFDSQTTARQVAARLAHVRQRSRWWPLPILRRSAGRTTTGPTTDFQPTPIPAINGHTPTVTGRTQTMFSPAKAITAAALVFGIGGVMLIAQPFDQQERSVPGAAEARPSVPVPFTMRFIPADSVRASVSTTGRGITSLRGDCWTPVISQPSDPRLAGTLTYCADEDRYAPAPEGFDASSDTYTPVGEESLVVGSDTYRIENGEGAWQGSSTFLGWTDPGSGDLMEDRGAIILVGEGAYEGLYAAMTLLPDWSDIRGVIFDGAPPVAPDPPTAE
jgi:hypothetical protein